MSHHSKNCVIVILTVFLVFMFWAASIRLDGLARILQFEVQRAEQCEAQLYNLKQK